MKKGKFIVFEGIDGAGKTTQINLLAARLEAEGRKIFRTAEPTDLPSGRALREALAGKTARTPCEMAGMFLLDRISHNVDAEHGFRAKLESGFDVISDRYYYSSMAYQGSLTDPGWVIRMNRDCPDVARPDLCIFLDLSPEQSMERISRGRSSTEIYENVEQLTKTREKFLEVFKSLPDENVAIVDASGNPDEIAETIYRTVKNFI